MDALKRRREAALGELDKLIQDRNDFPINYNHYYIDNVHKKRRERIEAQIRQHIPDDPQVLQKCSIGQHYTKPNIHNELSGALRRWEQDITVDMEEFSCEEALDCLLAIYKVRMPVVLWRDH